MSEARVVDWTEVPEAYATAELGPALVDWCRDAAARECRWLGLLAEFDRREAWRADGQLSCVDWLVWRCGLSARTARDKLRVAHELRRRPSVQDAFAAGSLSYSKVRAITRITDAGDETDAWLLKLAEAGTVADLERVAHRWLDLRDQERGIDTYLRRYDRRQMVASSTYDGMMVIEIVQPVEEAQELLSLLDAQAVDDGSAEPQRSTAQRRTDALMALVRAGRTAERRYTVHLVADVDVLNDRFGTRAETFDGNPIGAQTLRRLSCDCGVVRHLVKGDSQPLDIGTRTSVWTVGQRRSIALRDKGQCRFVGCCRRTCDVHHVVHYDKGGRTAVDNGILLCPRHHTAVHEGGFTISGEPNGTLVFHRPDGSEVSPTPLPSATQRASPAT